MVLLEVRRQLVDADAGRDGETADVVVDALRGDEVGQELSRIVEDFLRARLVENLRVLPAQLPSGEERRPVDERLELGEGNVVENTHAEERRRLRREVEARPAAARFLQRQDHTVV